MSEPTQPPLSVRVAGLLKCLRDKRDTYTLDAVGRAPWDRRGAADFQAVANEVWECWRWHLPEPGLAPPPCPPVADAHGLLGALDRLYERLIDLGLIDRDGNLVSGTEGRAAGPEAPETP